MNHGQRVTSSRHRAHLPGFDHERGSYKFRGRHSRLTCVHAHVVQPVLVHRQAAILAIIDGTAPTERKRPLARAGGRFARWNQKAVRERATSGQPSTLGAEIEGQIRLLNEESGFTGGNFVIGVCGYGCFYAAMHGQPSADTAALPDARPGSDRFRCGGRESKFLAVMAMACQSRRR